jgi:hypothetical protein
MAVADGLGVRTAGDWQGVAKGGTVSAQSRLMNERIGHQVVWAKCGVSCAAREERNTESVAMALVDILNSMLGSLANVFHATDLVANTHGSAFVGAAKIGHQNE